MGTLRPVSVFFFMIVLSQEKCHLSSKSMYSIVVLRQKGPVVCKKISVPAFRDKIYTNSGRQSFFLSYETRWYRHKKHFAKCIGPIHLSKLKHCKNNISESSEIERKFKKMNK